MVSSLLNRQQEFEKAKRNDLYYGRFMYCARFFLREASALRELDHNKISQTLFFRSSWSNKVIPDTDMQNVHNTCDSLLALENPFKTMVSVNWVYFYTNDIADIDYLCANTAMQQSGSIHQVVITHPKNTIGLKNPKHAYRTFVRSHKPTDQQKQSLQAFIKHNKKYIKVSNGLKDFLRSKHHRYYMADYYYIDHSDMKMVTALALMNPGLVRKTMPIVQVNS